MIPALRRALADTVAFYFAAHAGHWNVVGAGFPAYHEFLGDLYAALYEAIDPLAEHIRAVRGDAPVSLAEVLAETSLTELGAVADCQAPVVFARLLDMNERTIVSLRAALAAATEAGEDGLANFLQDRLDAHAKHGWMLRSVLA